ncbi:acyltransferase [Paenibacillus sp. GCM10027626]|uniref:acyltransferase n=1 Tax=Paenibacillus sp. GCM10027626 TaxID=3273411 RepID=UPI003635A618
MQENEQLQLQEREKLPQVQLIRAMAIIGVVTVHATSFATIKMKTSGIYWAYNFFNIFLRMGTPTFLFLSAFVLFYGYFNRPINGKLLKNFYSRRLKFILVPYIVFSVIYFTIMHYTYYENRAFADTIDSFFDKLLHGQAYTHLYFIFINVQFYVLFPLLLMIFKRKPSWTKWGLIIGFIVQWGYILLNKYYLDIDNKASYSFFYMSNFMLGAFLGIYYPKVKEWFIICRENATRRRIIGWSVLWIFGLCAAALDIYIWYDTRMNGARYNALMFEFAWNMHTYPVALMTLQIAHFAYRNFPKWIVRFFHRLGELSFGIYLVHPLFLFYYRQYPPTATGGKIVHLWYLGGFFVAMAGSWLVVAAITRWVPGSWMLFGKVSSDTKERKRKEQKSKPGQMVFTQGSD